MCSPSPMERNLLSLRHALLKCNLLAEYNFNCVGRTCHSQTDCFSCESLGADSLSCFVKSVLLCLTLSVFSPTIATKSPELPGPRVVWSRAVWWPHWPYLRGEMVQAETHRRWCGGECRSQCLLEPAKRKWPQNSPAFTDKPGSQLCSGVCPWRWEKQCAFGPGRLS